MTNYIFFPEDEIEFVARMIGNAVPPKLANFFANYLVNSIKPRASHPTLKLFKDAKKSIYARLQRTFPILRTRANPLPSTPFDYVDRELYCPLILCSKIWYLISDAYLFDSYGHAKSSRAQKLRL